MVLLTLWGCDFTPKKEISFDTEAVERGDAKELLNIVGKMYPMRVVTVGSRVSGEVVKVNVSENASVKKGDILAEIDPIQSVAQLYSAKAQESRTQAGLAEAYSGQLSLEENLAKARAGLDSSRASLRQQQSRILVAQKELDQARASIRAAEAELNYRSKELERSLELVKEELISVSESQLAKVAYENAKVQLERAKAGEVSARGALRQLEFGLEQSKAGVVSAEADLEIFATQRQTRELSILSAQAGVEEARADREKAEAQLSWTKVTAPIDGVVMKKLVEEGQTVQASFNIPELFKIAQEFSQLKITADVTEQQLVKLEVGKKVHFSVDAYPGKDFVAKVLTVGSIPKDLDASTGIVYPIELVAQNPEKKLNPGMSARLKVVVRELKDQLLVPSNALYVDGSPELEEIKIEEVQGQELEKEGFKGSVLTEKKGEPGVLLRHQVLVLFSTSSQTVIESSTLQEGDEVVLSVRES